MERRKCIMFQVNIARKHRWYNHVPYRGGGESDGCVRWA